MHGKAHARVLLVALLFFGPVTAGCLAGADLDAADADAPTPRPGQGVREDLLTDAEFGVLPQVIERVPVSVDGIRLHAEVYLPDGDGPWPTILEMSPYNVGRFNGHEELVPFDLQGRLIDHYVPRGYAVVLVHVRGTGNSEGCMDMMGAKEQQDGHDVVEWIAAQPWSDGKVGMHGVSYVGTTPHAAAIKTPEHLVTIVTIAGVTNQWRNTYQNGVPYDGRFYPLMYNAFSAAPPTDVTRGPDWALNAADAACDQEDAVASMSPGTYEKGVYSEYWAERNMTRGVKDVRASVLYSQGFVDRAVNPMEAIGWFNELDVPKKAFFHQAGHQYAPRDDYFTVEHAWFDHWLKGIENGVMDTPTVEVQLNTNEIRVDDAWPPTDAARLRFWLAPGALTAEPPADGEETYLADMARNAGWVNSRWVAEDPVVTNLAFESPALEEDVLLAGPAWMHLVASVDAENTFFLMDLYDVAPDGSVTWIAEGWFNAHLRDGFDKSAPLVPGEAHTFGWKFEPREYVFEAGHKVRLEIHGHDTRVFPVDELVTTNTVHYGAGGSWIELPVIENATLWPRPDGV